MLFKNYVCQAQSAKIIFYAIFLIDLS